MESILDYNHSEAKRFFLKEESYFNSDLPHYFVFEKLLQKISNKIQGKLVSDFYSNRKIHPCDCESVNYKFLNNKDGKFAWRPFQLIHPVLYTYLVHEITEKENWNFIINRFREFDCDPKIKCLSLPIESKNKHSDKASTIIQWWQTIEQKSIELALDYEYVLHIDISDCYGSIYTHSIVWALHTKEIGKKERKNNKLIGNIVVREKKKGVGAKPPLFS